MNYLRLGTSGDPVIALHGWGRDLESIRELGDLLARSYSVFLIDLPGFGKSQAPSSTWGTLEYASKILEFASSQGIERFHLLGHSFGGRVAIRIASLAPTQVMSLTLIGSAGLRPKRKLTAQLKIFLLKTLAKLARRADKLLSSDFAHSWVRKRFGSEDYRNAGEMRSILVKTINEDLTDFASQISSNSLLLWGELDDQTPVEMGQRLNRLIPNSKLILLPQKGHEPFHGAGAHLCATYILDFLNSLNLPGDNNAPVC